MPQVLPRTVHGPAFMAFSDSKLQEGKGVLKKNRKGNPKLERAACAVNSGSDRAETSARLAPELVRQAHATVVLEQEINLTLNLQPRNAAPFTIYRV